MNLAFRVKRLVKAMLIPCERLFPRRILDGAYSIVLPTYQSVGAFVYSLRRYIYLVRGDCEGAKKVEAVGQVRRYSLVGTAGLETTYSLAMEINRKRVRGSFVELGVAKGGCAALLGCIALQCSGPSRMLWLFDSFEGLPEPSDDDFSGVAWRRTGDHLRPLARGSCLGTIDEVRNLLLNKFALPGDKIELVKGWFHDTLPKNRATVGPVALLRIDADWYDSTKCCLEQLYDQVEPGGAIIVDDYYTCFGCKKAVREFTRSRELQVKLQFAGDGGVYFFKP